MTLPWWVAGLYLLFCFLMLRSDYKAWKRRYDD